ncbi:MAG: hypothetical protein LBK69_06135 [Syntrophomonadaceae bacterium]|jgi:hypothetical protein|nr:hypothetical protein [Syntrophomonadaceae bacterium]
MKIKELLIVLVFLLLISAVVDPIFEAEKAFTIDNLVQAGLTYDLEIMHP